MERISSYTLSTQRYLVIQNREYARKSRKNKTRSVTFKQRLAGEGKYFYVAEILNLSSEYLLNVLLGYYRSTQPLIPCVMIYVLRNPKNMHVNPGEKIA